MRRTKWRGDPSGGHRPRAPRGYRTVRSRGHLPPNVRRWDAVRLDAARRVSRSTAHQPRARSAAIATTAMDAQRSLRFTHRREVRDILDRELPRVAIVLTANLELVQEAPREPARPDT